MKKKCLIIIGGVLLALVIVQNIMFRVALNGYVTNDVYDDGLSGRLTAEEIDILDGIIRDGEVSQSNTCGYDGKFYVVINGDVYMPSLDGCGSIYNATKFTYINIPDEQRDTVNGILLNHISHLPTN